MLFVICNLRTSDNTLNELIKEKKPKDKLISKYSYQSNRIQSKESYKIRIQINIPFNFTNIYVDFFYAALQMFLIYVQ